jgi:hypothetical protein
MPLLVFPLSKNLDGTPWSSGLLIIDWLAAYLCGTCLVAFEFRSGHDSWPFLIGLKITKRILSYLG